MPVPRQGGPLNTIIVWGKLKRRGIKKCLRKTQLIGMCSSDAIVTTYRDKEFSTYYLRHCSCPFRKRSLPFLRNLIGIILNDRKLQARVKPGPRTCAFPLTTIPKPAKIPKNLSTYTSKLSFLTVTSVRDDPSPFQNF